MAGLSGNRAGLYATACEKSEHRDKIDMWLNEGKSYSYISKELKKLGEKISDKSISKYAKYRDEHITKQLMKDPMYQAQIKEANGALVEEIGKMKTVNVMNHIAETVEHCAELIAKSKLDDIKVKNIQDLRFVQSTMLESLKLYGDMMLKAQQFTKIEEDPGLLRPTTNVNVKNVLIEVLGGMNDDQRFQLVDRIREGIIDLDEEGLSGGNE